MEELLQTLRKKYPKRDGGNGWIAVARLLSRIAESEFAQVIAGTENYLTYCQRKGIIGTEYVMQARTFYGRDQHWLEYADMDMRTPQQIKQDALWADLDQRCTALGITLNRAQGYDYAMQGVLQAEKQALNAQWEARGMNQPKFLKVVS